MFLQFTPAYGFAFLQSGILPRAVFHKPPGRKTRCGKRTQTAVFHTVFPAKKCRAVRRLSGIALFFTSYCGTPAVQSGNRGSGCRRPRWCGCRSACCSRTGSGCRPLPAGSPPGPEWSFWRQPPGRWCLRRFAKAPFHRKIEA